MVKQVLMFVRGGSNDREPIAFNQLAEEVRHLLRETLPCSIRLTDQIPKELGMVLGDATQLHQVMINLCVNGRDAMPEGGELRLTVEEVEVDGVKAGEIGNVEPGRYVRLAVADTGTGMTPAVRAKIFDPFFTTKEAGKGTGLGLSTVATIVREHRGFVEVESQVGRGSRFLVYLPICEAPKREPEIAAADLPRGQGELVLVADNEHSVREITKLTLEAHNYRVLLAGDGAEALSVYVQNRGEVALVITDILMPIMNGRALIHALRKLTPAMPIVAFSGADRSNSLVGTLDDESLALLRKPATPGQLLTAVAAALRPAARADQPAVSRLAPAAVH